MGCFYAFMLTKAGEAALTSCQGGVENQVDKLFRDFLAELVLNVH